MPTPESGDVPLTIDLFGPFSVQVEGKPLPHLRSRKGQWLLALLALARLQILPALALGAGALVVSGYHRDILARLQRGPRRAPRMDIPMTRDEAWAVLGLHEGASPDAINAAHRRLIMKLHPDLGGSDYLAAKINRAREILLQRRDY